MQSQDAQLRRALYEFHSVISNVTAPPSWLVSRRVANLSFESRRQCKGTSLNSLTGIDVLGLLPSVVRIEQVPKSATDPFGAFATSTYHMSSTPTMSFTEQLSVEPV